MMYAGVYELCSGIDQKKQWPPCTVFPSGKIRGQSGRCASCVFFSPHFFLHQSGECWLFHFYHIF